MQIQNRFAALCYHFILLQRVRVCTVIMLSHYFTWQFNRKRLFGMMNDLPTVYEVISGMRQSKERDRSGGIDNSGRNKLPSKHTVEAPPPPRAENNARDADEGYDEDDGDHSETLCGTCGGIYSAEEFWIGCDVCERWYHGKCVKITPAKAESIKQYKCPSCSSKRPRQ